MVCMLQKVGWSKVQVGNPRDRKGLPVLTSRGAGSETEQGGFLFDKKKKKKVNH